MLKMLKGRTQLLKVKTFQKWIRYARKFIHLFAYQNCCRSDRIIDW